MSCHYSIFFLFDYLSEILYIHQTQIKTINKAVQRARKEGNTAKKNFHQIVSMESPFEILGWKVDPSHSDATSHEKPVLPKWTQNLNSLSWIASGDYRGTGNLKILRQLRGAPRIFFFSACWGKNEFFYAPEDQEQAKQPAHIGCAPLS